MPAHEIGRVVSLKRSVTTSNELQRLRANERRYRMLVEHTADVIVELSGKGAVTYASPAFYRLLGYSEGSWTGRAITDLVHPDDRGIVGTCVATVLDTAGPTAVPVVRVQTQAGTWRLVEGTVNNLLDDPDVGVLIATLRDVSDRHLADKRLRFQATLLDAIGQAVVATDLEGRITYWNRVAETMFGWAEHEVLDRSAVELLSVGAELPIDRLPIHEILAHLSRGDAWSGELMIRRKDGSVLPVDVTTAPVRDAKGELVGVTTISSETRARVGHGDRLEEDVFGQRGAGASREEQSELLDLVHDAIVVWEQEGSTSARIRFWNRGAETMFGWSAEEAVGSEVQQLLGAELPEELEAAADRFTGEGAWEGELSHRRRDGGTVLVQSRLVRRPGQVPVVMEVCRDVTEQRAAAKALEESEHRFRSLVQEASDVVVVVDRGGRITYASPSAKALFGYDPEEVEALDGPSLVHPDDLALNLEAFARVAEPGASTRAEYRVRSSDGRWRRVETVYTNLLHEPAVAGYVLNSRDVTERAETEARLVRSQQQLVIAQRLSLTGSWDLDLLGGSARWSEQLFRILGFREGQVVPSFMALLAAVHPEDRGIVAEARSRALGRSEPQEHRFRVVRRDGSVGTMLATIEAAFGDDGQPVRLTGAVQDVTERTVLEGALERQSFYDGLTELANRALFIDRLGHALQRRGRLGGAVAVLLVDLQEFRAVNDSLGHGAGDELLVTVGRRLIRMVRPSDTVARLGGDEFAVMLESADQASAEIAAQRILAAIDRPMQAQGHEVFIHTCIGIAVADDASATSDLLRYAELALHSAKVESRRQGRKSRYRVFDPSMHAEARRRLDLRRELQVAVERNEFLLRYQPIVRLGTARIVGVEALVRWQHPAMGVVPPADFIPMAEESGLIVPIGGWVLGEAVGWTQTINATRELDPARRGLNVSVNLSPRQLAEPNLLELVQDALESSGLDPRRLVMEITESVLVQDAETVVPVLRQLRERGVRVAVDDFGTGYSSLSYLRRLPIDVLKIDRSFVGGITEAAEDAAVARAVVKLAEALGLATVAEGIETPEQAQALADLGCTYGQGYLFSSPVPPAEIEEMLRAEASGMDEL